MSTLPAATGALAAAAAALITGLGWADENSKAVEPFYSVHALVSDGAAPAAHTDTNLVNAWGIVFNPTAVVWINNNGTNTATLYDGNGNKIPLTVAIPPGSNGEAGPTGIVFNQFNSSSTDFSVTANGVTAASVFIFAAENGTLLGWAPSVDRNSAVVAFDSRKGGARYKGLALGSNGQANFLYATDFSNTEIDVFDKNFKRVTIPGGNFKDPQIPAGYAPFGIRNIDGDLYITYAKQDAEHKDDVKGAGFGFVDVFDSNGNLIRRVASHGTLNAPWGIALAPADFGRFSNRLLIGNFGDGAISAFDPVTGELAGQLRSPNGSVLKIDGLWGLSFGNGVLHQPTNRLFFTAGPDGEAHGLYGRIDPAAGADPQTGVGDE